MSVFLGGGPARHSKVKEVYGRFMANPALANHLKWYELNPEEKQEDLWRRNKVIYELYGKEYFKELDVLEYPYVQWGFYF